MTVAGLKRRLTPGSKITWVNGYQGSGPMPLTVVRWKGHWLVLSGPNGFESRIKFDETRDETAEPPNGFNITAPDGTIEASFQWRWPETGETKRV